MSLSIESLSAAEQRTSFRVGDSWSRSSNFELRAGVRLSVVACQYEPSFSFSVVQPPSEIELVVSKGSVVLTRTPDGRELRRAGTALQLSRMRDALPLEIRAEGEATTECVSISMSKSHFRDLLGTSELPSAFRDVTESDDACPLVSRAMTPRLFRALDEISNADVRGPSRVLWHEAKSLELIALMTDELVEAAEAEAPRLSAQDIERLERARRALLEHLDAPPTLRALARQAGFNETKLKGGFRTLFGTSVFAYLRQARMEEARRLLLSQHLNVTEVAQRVGYANPSKFAAAFRRQYGMSPSAL